MVWFLCGVVVFLLFLDAFWAISLMGCAYKDGKQVADLRRAASRIYDLTEQTIHQKSIIDNRTATIVELQAEIKELRKELERLAPAKEHSLPDNGLA